MPSGNDDVTPAKTPTMLSARQISQIDDVRFGVEVEWEDHEDRDDELVTIFRFTRTDGTAGGSGSVYVGNGTGYTAAGTGRCKGTVVLPAGEFTVVAQCSRQVVIHDPAFEGGESQVSIDSEWSNQIGPVTVAPGATPQKPGKGQGKGPNK